MGNQTIASPPCPGLPGGALGLAAFLSLAAQPHVAEPAATTVAAAGDYRIGAGDVLRIGVYQNPDSHGDAGDAVRGIGSYPLLGNIRLGGLSVTAAEKLIAAGLRDGNFVRQPRGGRGGGAAGARQRGRACSGRSTAPGASRWRCRTFA
jgi:protein involved in polysaccharide export with SLBB domain